MEREFRERRALFFPLVFGVGLCIAVAVQSVAIGVPCAIALGLSVIVAIPLALSGRIEILARTMTVSGVPPYQRKQRHPGPVQLDRLATVHSVAQRYGAFTQLGPAIFRPLLQFTDLDGGELVMWAWGWERRTELFGILREAVVHSDARVDKVTIRRLRLKSQL